MVEGTLIKIDGARCARSGEGGRTITTRKRGIRIEDKATAYSQRLRPGAGPGTVTEELERTVVTGSGTATRKCHVTPWCKGFGTPDNQLAVGR